jgi:AcrR family transcriptional regulator
MAIGLPGSGLSGRRDDARLESKASRMHLLNRLRGQHFLAPVMADSAMDVMLSLFVGEMQRRAVSGVALATANLLSRAEVDSLIDRLVQAGLAVITGLEPDGRSVGLTPLGSARMRSFINDYPDV